MGLLDCGDSGWEIIGEGWESTAHTHIHTGVHCLGLLNACTRTNPSFHTTSLVPDTESAVLTHSPASSRGQKCPLTRACSHFCASYLAHWPCAVLSPNA